MFSPISVVVQSHSLYDNDALIISEQDVEMFEKNEGLWFYDDNGQPVQATLDMSIRQQISLFWPSSVEDSVFFSLYTKESKEITEFPLHVNDSATLQSSAYDPNKPTRIVTHGWINSKKSSACTLIRDGMSIVILTLWKRKCNRITEVIPLQTIRCT